MATKSEIPATLVPGLQIQLYNQLSSFWRQQFSKPGLASALCQASAVATGEAYLDLLEALDLRDPQRTPVFNRRLWTPVVIQQGVNDFVADPRVVAGKQTSEDLDPRVLLAGQPLDYKTMTYWSADIRDAGSSISDNPWAPTQVLLPGQDYVYHNNSLGFATGKDPASLGWPTRGGQEYLIWVSDSGTSAEWIPRKSRIFDLDLDSTEYSLGVLTALHQLLTKGCTEHGFKTFLARIFGIPIANATEVITAVGPGFIATDTQVYHTTAQYTVGQTIQQSEFLAPGLSVVFNPGIADSEIIPVVDHQGVLAGWTPEPIMYTGSNQGQPGFEFRLWGDPGFWDRVKSRAPDMVSALGLNLHQDWQPNPVLPQGYISPAQYFMDLWGHNVLGLSVDLALVDNKGLSLLSAVHKFLPLGLKIIAAIHDTRESVPQIAEPTTEYNQGIYSTQRLTPGTPGAITKIVADFA
jgi:hypothetical protein